MGIMALKRKEMFGVFLHVDHIFAKKKTGETQVSE